MVGAIFFSDRVEQFIPPKKGKSHILRIIREMLYAQPRGARTNLSEALKYLTGVVPKRCTAFVLSDFLTQGYEAAIKVAANRHDLVGIHVYDANEMELPDVGLLPVVDAETQEQYWVDTSSPTVRAEHSRYYQENLEYFRNTFWKNGADTVSIATNESYIKALMQFFRGR